MDKLWFILPLMLGCNSTPVAGVTDASLGNNSVGVSDAGGSGSNNLGLDTTLSEAGMEVHATSGGTGSASGVSCTIPLVAPRYYHHGVVHRFHRRRHHVCQ